MTRTITLFLSLLLCSLFTLVPAEAAKKKNIVVTDAWATPTLGVSGASAVYMTLTNNGKEDEVLLSVATKAAQDAQLHTSEMDGNIARMRSVSRLIIHGGETVHFEPGGKHIMLMQPKNPIKPGEKIRVVLYFTRSGTVPVMAKVQPLGYTKPNP